MTPRHLPGSVDGGMRQVDTRGSGRNGLPVSLVHHMSSPLFSDEEDRSEPVPRLLGPKYPRFHPGLTYSIDCLTNGLWLMA